jgi:hypothetical protein
MAQEALTEQLFTAWRDQLAAGAELLALRLPLYFLLTLIPAFDRLSKHELPCVLNILV